MRAPSLLALLLLVPLTAYAALININTADATLLDTLPGIGSSKANAIVQYRLDHGPFARIEDLMNVSGIGQATFDGLKDQITVGDTGAAPSASTTPASSTSSGASTYVPPPSALTVALSGEETVFAYVPMEYRAQAVSKSGEPDSQAQLSWSFGDGSAQSGTVVEKTYEYPGTYVLSVSAQDGVIRATSERVVRVVSAQVGVRVEAGKGIVVTNDTDVRLDLSGWRIESGGTYVRLPHGLIVLPHSSIMLASDVTHLPTDIEAFLWYPGGSLAARSGVDALEPVQPLPDPVRIQEVKATISLSPGAPERSPQHTYEDAVLAPAAASDLAAAGAPVLPATTTPAHTNRFSPWLVGLVGVVVAAGSAFVLI